MELKFVDNEKIKCLAVDSNSLVKDVLLKFLTENNYEVTLDTSAYIFRFGPKILNSPRFLENKVSNVLKAGNTIQFINKNNISYAGGEHIRP